MKFLIVGINDTEIQPKVDDLVCIKPDIYTNTEGKNEQCLKVYLMTGGIQSLLLGHVAREFLGFKLLLENKLAQVVNVFAESNNRQQVKVSKDRQGVCLCRTIY